MHDSLENSRAKYNKDRDTSLTKFDKVSKKIPKKPLASSLMDKELRPSWK